MTNTNMLAREDKGVASMASPLVGTITILGMLWISKGLGIYRVDSLVHPARSQEDITSCKCELHMAQSLCS